MPVPFATIDDAYMKTPELKREDVSVLKEWMSKQSHLPVISDLQAALFLNCCYFKMEATKTCVEKFFTLRTHCPEFFANRDPFARATRQQLRVVLHAVLPEMTAANYRVHCLQFANTDTDLFVFADACKVIDMCLTLYNQTCGLVDGDVIVFDSKGLQLGHILKINLLGLKKALYYVQEAMPAKLKEVHILNVGAITEKLLGMVKPFLTKELYDMIHMHRDYSSFHKYVPKNILPEEYGGQIGSIYDLHQEALMNIEESADFLKEDELLKSDESKRQGKSIDYDNIFGVEGTFKKLDID